MSVTTRYRINAPQVIHETIERETVIINLEAGTYYSLDALGAEVWNRVAAGETGAEVAAALRERDAAADEAVPRLLRQLRQERLIVPVDGEADEDDGALAELADSLPGEPDETFVLRKYTDMRELLLLDPIHEVQEAGWPYKK